MSESKEQREQPGDYRSSAGYAVNDRDATFAKVAFYWSEDSQTWSMLCAGRSENEFQERLKYWIGKGIERKNIREYECRKSV